MAVGAHVSYLDRENFGRRFVDVPAGRAAGAGDASRSGRCRRSRVGEGTRVAYVKPHGALYNAVVHHEEHAAGGRRRDRRTCRCWGCPGPRCWPRRAPRGLRAVAGGLRRPRLPRRTGRWCRARSPGRCVHRHRRGGRARACGWRPDGRGPGRRRDRRAASAPSRCACTPTPRGPRCWRARSGRPSSRTAWRSCPSSPDGRAWGTSAARSWPQRNGALVRHGRCRAHRPARTEHRGGHAGWTGKTCWTTLVRDRGPALLRYGYLLTGDPGDAQERCRTPWSRCSRARRGSASRPRSRGKSARRCCRPTSTGTAAADGGWGCGTSWRPRRSATTTGTAWTPGVTSWPRSRCSRRGCARAWSCGTSRTSRSRRSRTGCSCPTAP